MEALAYTLAILIGISLGVIGSGGSILTIPILVYILDVDPVSATSYSLFIVGITSLVGGIRKAKASLVDFGMVLYFGIPSIFMVLVSRAFIVPNIPITVFHIGDFVMFKSTLIMVLFAVVMLMASFSMIRSAPTLEEGQQTEKKGFSVFFKGMMLGTVTGFVGAGGGFLIIPALVVSTKMPMSRAVGTSLFIVAFNSIVGFLGYQEIDEHPINWHLLLFFTMASIAGVFIGNEIAKRLPPLKLKVGFGYFVLLMGIYIFIKELFFT